MNNKNLLVLFLALAIGTPALADLRFSSREALQPEPAPENMRRADPQVLEQLRRQDLRNPGLPRHMTAAEQRVWQLPDLSGWSIDNAPDVKYLRPPAEYEANDAILMRWGWGSSVLTDMIVPITTGDSRARVMLIVSSQSQQNSAASTLASAGANLNRIDFVQAASDSVWIRDYGPRFASGDFARMIVDHDYDRPRPNDNNIPSVIAANLGIPLYELPLAQGGGNYHSFANGEAFITSTIFYYNPGVNGQQVQDYFAAVQGVDMTVLGTLGVNQSGGTGGTWYDGTGHLDMWFMPIDDNTVMIGQYNPAEWGGIPHQVSEAAVTEMQNRGYTVIRTPGWRAGGAHYTYTNGVIVNDLVMMCTFNGYPTQNAQALAAYELAFPDRTIVPVNCSDIIGASGALHCIVKHKPFDEGSNGRRPYYNWSR